MIIAICDLSGYLDIAGNQESTVLVSHMHSAFIQCVRLASITTFGNYFDLGCPNKPMNICRVVSITPIHDKNVE